MRIAVIGGAAAGPAVVAEAVRQNPRAEIVLFEEGPHISIAVCELPYALGEAYADVDELVVLPPDRFEATRGGTVRTRHRVRSIRPRERRLVVEALDYGATREEYFDRFVLCTGARARRLELEGEEAPNVFALRGLEDGRVLRAWLEVEPVRHVVIAGAGYIGLEVAEVLRERGVRVTLLDPLGRVLGEMLDAAIGKPFDEAVRRAGVIVRAERPVGLRLDGHGRVRAVLTDRGEVVGCDALVVAVGVRPETALAEAAGLRIGRTGAVAVDEGMRTSAPNVWACGDCVEVPHAVSGQPTYVPLAQVARRGARVAARNAAAVGGRRATFEPVTGIAGVRAFGMEAAAIGLDEAAAREVGFDPVAVQIRHVSRPSSFPGARPLWVRVVAERGSGRLLGAQLVGAEGAALRANALAVALLEGYTAAEFVRRVDLLYNPPLAPAVDPLLVACSQAARAAGAPVRR